MFQQTISPIPAAEHVFGHLSASIVLSRKRASEGLYPAIDLLQSNSAMATPGIVGEEHYALAQEIRKTLAQYEALKDIVAHARYGAAFARRTATLSEGHDGSNVFSRSPSLQRSNSAG